MYKPLFNLPTSSHILKARNRSLLSALITIKGAASALLANTGAPLSPKHVYDVEDILYCAMTLQPPLENILHQVERESVAHLLASKTNGLRTPAATIVSYAEMLWGELSSIPSHENQNLVAIIYDQAASLWTQLNDLFCYAQIETGTLIFSHEFFDLALIIDQVVTETKNLIKTRPLSVYFINKEGIPPAYGDAFRTRQALSSLFAYTAQMLTEGTLTLMVRLLPDSRYDRQQIEISLNATGQLTLTPKQSSAVEQQWHSLERALLPHVDLALSLAHLLVEMQGGMFRAAEIRDNHVLYAFTLPTQPNQAVNKPRDKSFAADTLSGTVR